ncbi:unnamed protein product [Arctogadus glacialis]
MLTEKRLHFAYSSMKARTLLSVMDNNENVGRQQATTSDAELRWKMSTGWEQDLFDGKAAVLATAEGRSIRIGTGGDSYGFTFDQVTAMDPVAESPSTLAGRCPS